MSQILNICNEIAESIPLIEEKYAEEGYTEGRKVGYNEGHAEGYEEGYNAGVESGPNEEEIYEQGYTEGLSDGQQAEYDRFWDAFQDHGRRTSYLMAFANTNLE